MARNAAADECFVFGQGALGTPLSVSGSSMAVFADKSSATSDFKFGIQTTDPEVNLAVHGDASISGSLSVGDPLAVSSGWDGYGDMYVQNDVEVGGNLSVGRSLTASELFLTNGTEITGSGEWTDAGSYLIPEEANEDVQIDGDMTINGGLTVGSDLSLAGVMYLDNSDRNVVINEDLTVNADIEIYESSRHPVLGITAAHAADHDPQVKFRTGADPQTDYSLGVDAGDGKFKIYSGDGVGGTAEFAMSTSGVVSIANLELGSQSFATNAGQVTWIDMPVTSAASAGTAESYTAALDGNDMLTIYGESDGAGSIQNTRVELGSDTSVSGSLTVDGDTLYVDAAQDRVGIGLINPDEDLEIRNTTAATLKLSTNDSTASATIFYEAADLRFHNAYNDSAADIIFQGRYSGDEVMIVKSRSGVVGIRDEDPDALLEVSAQGESEDLLYLSSDDEADGDLFIVKNSGSVGINTLTPSAELAVLGDVSVSGALSVGDPGSASSGFSGYGDAFFQNDVEVGSRLSVGSSLTASEIFLADGTEITGSGEWTDAGNYLIPNEADEDVQIDGSATISGDLTTGSRLFTDEIAAEADAQITVSSDMSVNGSLTVDGDTLFVDAPQNYVGIATADPEVALHVGTTSPSSITSLTDSVMISGELEVGGNMYTGSFQFAEDAGMVTWIDMPVSNTPSAGTEESYAAQLDGNDMLTVYGEADGTGGIQNTRIDIAVDTSISGALSVEDNIVFPSDSSEIAGVDDLYVSGGSLYFNANELGSGEWTDAGNYLIPGDAGEDVQINGDLTINQTLSIGNSLTLSGSFQLPLTTSGNLVADGHVGIDTTYNALGLQIAGDGSLITSSTDVRLPLIQQKDMTVMEPDQVQGVSDAIPMFAVDSYNFPSGIVVVAVRVCTDAGSTLTVGLEDWTDPTTKNQDIEPNIALGGGSSTTVSGADIDNATVTSGHYIYLNLDTTNVNWLKVTVWYYVVD